MPAPAPGRTARCLRPRPLSPAPGSALLSLAEKVVQAPGGGALCKQEFFDLAFLALQEERKDCKYPTSKVSEINQFQLSRGLSSHPFLRLLYDTVETPGRRVKTGEDGVKPAGKGSGRALQSLFSPSTSGLAVLFI